MGLFDTVALAGTLVLALPIGMLGLEFIAVRGEPVTGVGFVAVAAMLVVGQHYLGLPNPGTWLAKTVVGRVAVDPEEATAGDAPADDGDEAYRD